MELLREVEKGLRKRLLCCGSKSLPFKIVRWGFRGWFTRQSNPIFLELYYKKVFFHIPKTNTMFQNTFQFSNKTLCTEFLSEHRLLATEPIKKKPNKQKTKQKLLCPFDSSFVFLQETVNTDYNWAKKTKKNKNSICMPVFYCSSLHNCIWVIWCIKQC